MTDHIPTHYPKTKASCRFVSYFDISNSVTFGILPIGWFFTKLTIPNVLRNLERSSNVQKKKFGQYMKKRSVPFVNNLFFGWYQVPTYTIFHTPFGDSSSLTWILTWKRLYSCKETDFFRLLPQYPFLDLTKNRKIFSFSFLMKWTRSEIFWV